MALTDIDFVQSIGIFTVLYLSLISLFVSGTITDDTSLPVGADVGIFDIFSLNGLYSEFAIINVFVLSVIGFVSTFILIKLIRGV